MNQAEQISQLLRERGVKPSYQRIKIYEFLSSHFVHPSAEQIFDGLKNQIPTMSKSTVYCTLKSFVNARLVREITIDDNGIRYEFNMEDHGHFKCEKCGAVYDFNADIDSLHINGLENFQIGTKDLYFKGICAKCFSGKTVI